MLRLLTAGRSLVSSQNPASRYRMNKRRLLPKFESHNNPFASQSSEVAQANPAPVIEPKTVEATATLPEEKPLPVCAKEPTTEKPAKKSSEPKKFKPSPWKEKFAGFVSGVRKKLRKKSAAPRLPQPTVQGELSLDRVRVLRNDLSDTDFEVVTAKPSRRTVPGMATALPEFEPELAASALGGVRFRFFGAEET